MVRKNAKPVWGVYNRDFCVKCGKTFQTGESVLFGKFCETCTPKKLSELKRDRNPLEPIFWEFSEVCVSCARKFKMEDEILFGKFCKKCGKKWIKERDLRQPKLKKARNLGNSYSNSEKSSKIPVKPQEMQPNLSNVPNLPPKNKPSKHKKNGKLDDFF